MHMSQHVNVFNWTIETTLKVNIREKKAQVNTSLPEKKSRWICPQPLGVLLVLLYFLNVVLCNSVLCLSIYTVTLPMCDELTRGENYSFIFLSLLFLSINALWFYLIIIITKPLLLIRYIVSAVAFDPSNSNILDMVRLVCMW